MYFRHSAAVWGDFPELVPAVLHAEGIAGDAHGAASRVAASRVAAYTAIAGARLAGATESELPEIRAWRRAFSRMGLRPTQHRCAAESLLRRYRLQGSLPAIHPLVDLCNAVSLAFAIPVAVLDVARIADFIEVRHADGDEEYLAFSGETERPAAREVIFADGARRAHARRWTSRQSAYSAVTDATTGVLIVAEAMHGSAAEDVRRLAATVADELRGIWPVALDTAILSRSAPRFAFSAG